MSELRAAAERVRLDGEPGERWGATAGGLALVVGLTMLDASWSESFPTAVVIGPFLAALLAVRAPDRGGRRSRPSPRVLLSGIWNDNAVDADYFVRAAVVIVGGAIAVARRAPPRRARRAPRRSARS